jgi:hypothetical protein
MELSGTLLLISKHNKADAPNPAMTSLFQSGHHGRRVGDLQRWTT